MGFETTTSRVYTRTPLRRHWPQSANQDGTFQILAITEKRVPSLLLKNIRKFKNINFSESIFVPIF